MNVSNVPCKSYLERNIKCNTFNLYKLKKLCSILLMDYKHAKNYQYDCKNQYACSYRVRKELRVRLGRGKRCVATLQSTLTLCARSTPITRGSTPVRLTQTMPRQVCIFDTRTKASLNDYESCKTEQNRNKSPLRCMETNKFLETMQN